MVKGARIGRVLEGTDDVVSRVLVIDGQYLMRLSLIEELSALLGVLRDPRRGINGYRTGFTR